MPAVLTFWQTPEDEQEFLEFLRAQERVVAVPDHWVRSERDLEPLDVMTFVERYNSPQFALGIDADAIRSAVAPVQRNGELFYHLQSMQAPLIGYRRGQLIGHQLTRSNLDAYWDYPNEDATEMVRKEPEFIRWAKKVFAWVRRRTPETLSYQGHDYRATRRAAEAARAGQFEPIL